MENAILTWVAGREYIPNTLYANVWACEFIWLVWRLHETAVEDCFVRTAGGASLRSGRTQRTYSSVRIRAKSLKVFRRSKLGGSPQRGCEFEGPHHRPESSRYGDGRPRVWECNNANSR